MRAENETELAFIIWNKILCYLKRVTWNVRRKAHKFILCQGKQSTEYAEREIKKKNKIVCYLKRYKVQFLHYTHTLKCLSSIKLRYTG